MSLFDLSSLDGSRS